MPATADAGSAVAAGGALAEVDALVAANRAERTAERDVELVAARRRAVAELRSLPRAPVAPVATDPFPGVEGIPEVGPEDLDAEVLAGAIAHHGSVIVRGLLDPGTAVRIRDDVDRAFAAHRAEVAGAPPEEVAPWCVLMDDCDAGSCLGVVRSWVLERGGISVGEAPPLLFEVLEAYRDAGLLEVISDHLGGRPVIDPGKVTARKVAPVIDMADWHQDGAFFGTAVRTVNVWTALTRCGGDSDAPGIEIVPRRLDDVVETGTDEANYGWSVGDAAVRRIMGGRPTAEPLFEPGDAVLFDHLNLHRTISRVGHVRDRYAIEAWFFSPTDHPKGSQTFLAV